MSQHRSANSSGVNDSAVFTHLAVTWHSFKTENVHIMDRDMRWHQRGIKEAIWVRAKQPSLKRNGGTRVNLPHAWDRVINDLPRRLTSGGKTLLKVQPQRNNLVKGHVDYVRNVGLLHHKTNK